MKRTLLLAWFFSLLVCGCGASEPAPAIDTWTQETVDASQPDVVQEDTQVPPADTSVAEDVVTAPDPFEGVGAIIEARMKRANIPGLAAAVTARGKVLWTGAYGLAHVAEARPVTVDTPFMLASVSKTVTAVAIMRAVQDGKLALEDPINTHLPFTVDNPQTEGEVILMRHLVSHTSGIRDNWGQMPYSDGDSTVSLGDFVKGYLVDGGAYYDAAANFSATMPGEAFEYGNVATALAGYVVEVVTETPFDDYCDTHIFSVLGMPNTGWHLADFNPENVAMPYTWSNGNYQTNGHYGYADYPDGQLRSSVSDLARFLAAISNQGELDGANVLHADTVTQLLSPQAPDVDDTQYVFWYQGKVKARTVIGHGGSDIGVATRMAFSAETGFGVIILMNISWSDEVTSVATELQALLFDRTDLL